MKATTIPIVVTAEHIRIGISGSCFRCPLAYAINEAIPSGRGVQVFTHTVQWWDVARGRCVCAPLPPRAVRFVRAFDWPDAASERSVEPFAFELTVLPMKEEKR
ncbi:MAG: hypothetical protein ACREQ5_33805 [Candidatus Dormibacteria bacterium]